MLQNQHTLAAGLQVKVLGRSTNKKGRGFLVLFLCFYENEYSDYYENQARDAFNVIRRVF
jgi:hypothetical protein